MANFDTAVNAYWSTMVSNMCGAIAPIATSMLGIYIVIWGWSMLRGHIEEPVLDGLARMTRLAMIVSIALSAGYYNQMLGNWIWATPDYLAGLGVSGGGGTSSTLPNTVNTVVSTIIEDYTAVSLQVADSDWSEVISSLPTLAIAIGMTIAVMVLLIYMCFLLILSKLAIALLIGVGPIFILSLMFESSKSWFSLWWSQILNYCFLALLSGSAGAMILSFLMNYLSAANLTGLINAGTGYSNSMIPPIAIAGIGSLLLTQTPSMASGIAGGVAVSTLGVMGQALGGGHSRMMGIGKSAKQMLGRELSGRARMERIQFKRQKMANREWAKNNRWKGFGRNNI